MTSELHKNSGNFHQPLSQQLVWTLMESGPTGAFAKAREAMDDHDESARTAMYEACGRMLADEDAAKKHRALDFMAWDAEMMPDSRYADALTYDAKIDARSSQTRPYAERMFRIAIAHLVNATNVEGFEPTPDFIRDVESVLARTEEEDFGDMYIAAIEKLAPVGLAAIEAFVAAEKPEEDDFARSEKIAEITLNSMLERISSGLDGSDPAMAARARELMTVEYIKTTALVEHEDHLLTQAFLAGSFDEARSHIGDGRLTSFKLWQPMIEVMASGDRESLEWGNKVITTLLEVRPDYFSQYNGDESIDIFLDSRTGIVLGMLARADIYEPLLARGDTPESGRNVAMGVAYGLGQMNNSESYQQFLAACPHLEEAIHLNYAAGRAVSIRP